MSFTDEAETAWQRLLDGLPPKQSEPKDCRHESFASNVMVARLEDVGKFVADVRVVCVSCREPFRFVGLQAGLRFDMPTCTIDGLEAHLPIEPEVEKRLFAAASFKMPEKPETRQ